MVARGKFCALVQTYPPTENFGPILRKICQLGPFLHAKFKFQFHPPRKLRFNLNSAGPWLQRGTLGSHSSAVHLIISLPTSLHALRSQKERKSVIGSEETISICYLSGSVISTRNSGLNWGGLRRLERDGARGKNSATTGEKKGKRG